MEKPNNTSKKEKQKMAIGIGGGGGGGVGGLLVWGGVALIATFISVSAIRFRKKRAATKSHHPPSPILSTDLSKELELGNNNNDQGQGLRVLLQVSSSPTDNNPSKDETIDMPVAQIDPSLLAVTKSSILDDNPKLDISSQNKNPTYLEILISDNSRPKSSPYVIEKEPTEDLMDVEVTEGKTKGKAIEAPHADQFAEKDDNPQMQLIGTEKDEEKIVEIGEELIETVEGDREVTEQEFDHKEVTVQKCGGAIETAEKDRFAVEDELEEIEVVQEVETIEAPDAIQIEVEDNPQMQLTEEEQEYDQTDLVVVEDDDPQVTLSEDEEDSDEIDVDEDEEEIAEKVEESSEGTSMESNAEAIWPAESLQELSLELKEEVITNDQTVEEKIDEYRAVKNDRNVYANGHHNDNEDTGKLTMASSKRNMKELFASINLSKTDSSNLRIWIWSATSVLLMLLVVLPLLLSPAHIVKLCLIGFLVVILSQV